MLAPPLGRPSPLLFLLLSCHSVWVVGTLCTQEGTTAPALVQVNTSRGAVLGYHVDFGTDSTRLFYGQADVFEGIPYVQAPTGPLRFKKPVPLSQFSQSPYNATFKRPACPQNDHSAANADQSEDCLYLNVFTPDAGSIVKRPVMLWIHGGSLKTGSTRQYETPDDFPPNRGMLDQVEAIRWVKEEIGKFGGNPYQITLFGESAGSASVAAHLLSPLSNQMFQQAIMESGSVLTCFDGSLGFQNTSVNMASALCNFTTADWNSYNYTQLTACFQNMQPSQWLPQDSVLILGWQMVQDDAFLPDVPRNLQQKRPNIPVIYGNCHDEWSAFQMDFIKNNITQFTDFSKSQFELFFALMASYLANRELDVEGVLEGVYKPLGVQDNNHLGWFKTSSDIFTALGFTGFIRREIDWFLTAQNERVFAYEMTYATDIARNVQIPGWKPVGHTCELPFLFMKEKDWTHAAETGQLRPEDRELADWFADAWTTFAKFGRPSLVADAWPPLRKQELQYLRVGAQRSVQKFYRRRDAWLWNNVLPSLIGFWPPERVDHNNGTSAWHAWNPSKNSYV